MRVLYLCHRLPYPLDKGEKIRAFHELRAIAAAHEVDLFTLADGAGDAGHRLALLRWCRRVVAVEVNARLQRLRALPYLLTGVPLTLPCFYAGDLARQVRRALRERSYDRIVVYCSAMAQYVSGVSGIPIVTDFVDVDSDKWAQYAGFTRFPYSAVYRREARALRAYERQICGRSSSVVVTTEREARLVREIAGTADVRVVPNGVDTGYFQPAGAPEAESAPTIGFVGDMSYFPNEDAACSFARKVLPLVRRSVPEARFLIVGRNPSRNVRALKGLPGVEVTGGVPDIRTYLARMAVSVAPFSIAAGIQNKILEAMAFGIPVVATSRATQGLSPKAAGAVSTADTAEHMAATIAVLLQNGRHARDRGKAGRLIVTEEYSWERSLEGLVRLIESAATTPRPATAHASA